MVMGYKHAFVLKRKEEIDKRRRGVSEGKMGVGDPTNSSAGFKSTSSKGREEICVCVSLASKVCVAVRTRDWNCYNKTPG